MKRWSVFLFFLIASCQNQNSENTNDLSRYDYSIVTGYPNSEDFGGDTCNVYIHFSGTQYILNLKFLFSNDDTVGVYNCALLEFDDSVDVDEWINMHHGDATNMYTYIDPKSYLSNEYKMDLKIDSIVPVSASPREAVFSVLFENVSFKSSDKFISAITLDRLVLYNYSGFVFIGPADSIAFWKPSPLGDVIDPEMYYMVIVKVLNKIGCSVDFYSSYTVKCVSTTPDFGIISDSIKETDSTGEAAFKVEVTNNGERGDTIRLVASLVSKPTVTDTAFLVVAMPMDRLYILYNDTAKYNPEAEIAACLGDRVPVKITASQDGILISTKRNSSFNIAFEGDLAAYETKTSTDKITTSQLIDGKVTIWIEATGKNVTDGQINLTSNDRNLVSAERGNINFEACLP